MAIGNLEEIRSDGHAVLSIRSLELPCLADEKSPQKNQLKIISFIGRSLCSINSSSKKQHCDGGTIEPVDQCNINIKIKIISKEGMHILR